MGHEDRGHYAAKHQGVDVDQNVAQALQKYQENGILTCASAHRVARDLGIDPSGIGVQADLQELRIAQCQMGLFGHPKGKKLDPEIQVDEKLWNTLEAAADDGRISCAQCWAIAKEFKCAKLHVGSACEKLGLRIKPCQLGAF